MYCLIAIAVLLPYYLQLVLNYFSNREAAKND